MSPGTVPSVVWSGEEAHGATLHAEIGRALSTLRSGTVEIDDDPDGQYDHEIVDVHEMRDGYAWWRITMRSERVTIERGDAPGTCHVTIDRLHDAMTPSRQDEGIRACAEAHLEMAERLLSTEPVRDPEAEDRLEGIADDLARHAYARHGPCREVMAMVNADGPFGIGRSSGHASVVSPNPRFVPPTTTPAFLAHVDEVVGPAVRVSIEDSCIAVIGVLSASTLARPDAIEVLRELSNGDERRDWTS